MYVYGDVFLPLARGSIYIFHLAPLARFGCSLFVGISESYLWFLLACCHHAGKQAKH